MKTFTNTKKIPATLLYDLLKNSFKEMFPKKLLQYGIAENTIAVEKDGILLFHIDVNDEEIKISPVDDKNKDIEKKLEKFIEASLL